MTSERPRGPDPRPEPNPPTAGSDLATTPVEKADPSNGLQVARAALAAAKVEAKRRGLEARGGDTSRGGAKSAGQSSRRRRANSSARSGAHPDDRDPQLLDSSLDRLVADRGWETDAAVGGAMGRWPVIAGPQIAEHSTPVSFADGELVVAAASSAWATQLRLLAPTLLRRIALELGENTVQKVTVLGPSAPSWKRGQLRIKGRGPRDTYG